MDFKNAIITLTSNLGSDVILEGIAATAAFRTTRDVVMQMPSIRSGRSSHRLDEIASTPLTKEDLKDIAIC